MSELPLPAIISWLIHERHGGYDAETKLLGQMARIPTDQVADAETFRKLLLSQSEEAVRALFRERLQELAPEADAAILDREASLFFNQPSALPNYAYWGRMAVWSIAEATALVLGRDPSVVNWQTFEAEGVAATSFAVKYRSIGDLIHRSVIAGLLDNPLEPSLFLAWSTRMQLFPPQELVSEIEKVRGQQIDWRVSYWRLSDVHQQALNDNQAWSDAYAEQADRLEEAERALRKLQDFAMQTLQRVAAERVEHSQEIDELRAELGDALESKALDPRERDSVSKIVAGIALAKYGHKPSARRTETVANIMHDLDHAGVSVSDETIRKLLKRGVELLPPEVRQRTG